MTCAEGILLLTKLDMSRAPPEIRYSIRVHADILHTYGIPAHASRVRPFCYTVKSFVELAQSVLSLPGAPPLLSRRITQDPLEKFFGLQRQRGRVNENPNSQEFFKNSQALRVIQACSTSVKGNCRGNACRRTDTPPAQKLIQIITPCIVKIIIIISLLCIIITITIVYNLSNYYL